MTNKPTKVNRIAKKVVIEKVHFNIFFKNNSLSKNGRLKTKVIDVFHNIKTIPANNEDNPKCFIDEANTWCWLNQL